MEVPRFIQTYKYGIGWCAKERNKVYGRAKSYQRLGDGVMELLPGRAMVVVPRLAEMQAIVLDTHRTMGHFGVQRVIRPASKEVLVAQHGGSGCKHHQGMSTMR